MLEKALKIYHFISSGFQAAIGYFKIAMIDKIPSLDNCRITIPTNTFVYLIVLVLLFLSEESIPDEFYSFYINQTQLLTAIFNYTSMIPDLQLLIQRMNSSLSETEEKEPQITNTTQNCTNSQSNQSQAMAPPCRHAIQAPGKEKLTIDCKFNLRIVGKANVCVFVASRIS